MTESSRISLTGWKSWQNRRRRHLRATGIPFATATMAALYETRCRARIAVVIGRHAAKELRLTACQGDIYDDPHFVLPASTDHNLWQQLQGIPGLLRPIEDLPE